MFGNGKRREGEEKESEGGEGSRRLTIEISADGQFVLNNAWNIERKTKVYSCACDCLQAGNSQM